MLTGSTVPHRPSSRLGPWVHATPGLLYKSLDQLRLEVPNSRLANQHRGRTIALAQAGEPFPAQASIRHRLVRSHAQVCLQMLPDRVGAAQIARDTFAHAE